MESGKIYKFQWLAANSVGSSLTSKILTVAAIDKFAAPASLTKVSALSSQSSLYVEWAEVSAGTLPGGEVLGYRLKLEDVNNGTTWIVYDGQEYG